MCNRNLSSKQQFKEKIEMFMEITLVWDVTLYSLVKRYQPFGGSWCLCVLGMRRARRGREGVAGEPWPNSNQMKDRWAEHAACMGALKNVYKILAIKWNGKDHLRDLSIDKRIVLKCILSKQGVCGLDFRGSVFMSRVWDFVNTVMIVSLSWPAEQLSPVEGLCSRNLLTGLIETKN
jgi:hypothetical protein